MPRSLEKMSGFLRGPYFIAGVAVALGYYFVDAMVMAFWFEEGSSLWNNIVSPTADDVWMRSFAALILVVLGALVQERMTLQQKKSDFLARGLSDTEARLQLILDSVPAAISYFDNDVRFRFANERYTTLMNVRPEALIGKTLREAAGEKIYRVAEKNVKRALAGELVTFQNKVTGAAGADMAISVSYVPHRGQDGTVDGFFAFAFDITKHKQSEDALRATAEDLNQRVNDRSAELEEAMVSLEERQRQLDALADANPSLVSHVGADLRYRYVNKAYADWFGKSANEIVGKTVWELHGEDQYQHLKPHIDAVLSGEELNFSTKLDPLKTGEHWIQGRLLPDFDGNSKVIGYFVFTSDITDLKHAEMEAVRQKSLSEQYLHVAANMMVALDLEGRITLLNRAGCEILECDENEALGLDWFANFIPEDRRDLVRAKFDYVVNGGVEPSDAIEGHIVTAKGTRKLIRWSAAPVRNSEGKIIGILASSEDITESRMAEEKLRESEERFESFMAHVPAVAFMKDEDGRNLYINETQAKLLGMDKSGWLGKTDFDFFPAETAEHFRQNDLAVMESGKAQVFEETSMIEGYRQHWLVSKFVLEQADEKKLLCGIGIDITERKEAEVSLQEIQGRFEAFMSHNTGIAGIKDADGRILFVNDAYMMESPKADEVDQQDMTDMDLFNKESAEQFRRNDLTVLESGEPMVFEETLLQPDGLQHWLVSKFPIEQADGTRLLGMHGIDITENKRAEEKMRESEGRYRSIVDTTNEGFWRIDEELKIVEVNDAICQMLGYKREEILGRKSYTLMDDAEVPEMKVLLEEAMEQGGGVRALEGRLRKKDGTPLDVHMSATNFIDEAGNPVGRFAFITDITKMKRSEEALRASEERFAFAVKGSQDGLWDWDIATGEAYISPRWKEIVGYQDHELENARTTFLNVIYPDDFDRVMEAHRAHLEERTPFDIEFRFCRKEGGTVWVQAKGQAIWDENGQPLRMAGSITDISARKQAEEALQASEKAFANAQRIAGMGSWEQDLKTGEISWSDETYEIFGLSKDSFEPGLDKFFKHVLPDDHEEIRDLMARSLASTEKMDVNYRILRPDGEIRYIESSCEMVPDEKGEPRRLTGVNRDVTERHKAEEALRASEARLTEILDIAPEAVITVSEDMNIQLFNEGAERIFGYEASEMLGQSLDVLMPETFRESHRRKVDEFDRSGSTYRLMDRRQEIIGLRKDGSEFPAAASVSKLEWSGEKIFTVMLLDITERKLTRDALIEAKHESEVANRAKSEFLAAMSHDLRTPLNAILGFADVINHQYFGPVGDKYREYAADIRTSGKHLLSLVNEILDLSALEAGKKSLSKEWVDFQKVIAECETIVAPRARSAGITLTKQMPEGHLHIVTDRRAIMQILLNLLSNAIKFTGAGGKISLSVDVSDGQTVITIADTGMGIEEETLKDITEPFVQGHYSPYLANEGWGLGLAIVKSLVSLLDGKFEIKSRVGHGTTIKVILPTGQLDQKVETPAVAN